MGLMEMMVQMESRLVTVTTHPVKDRDLNVKSTMLG